MILYKCVYFYFFQVVHRRQERHGHYTRMAADIDRSSDRGAVHHFRHIDPKGSGCPLQAILRSRIQIRSSSDERNGIGILQLFHLPFSSEF